MLSLSNLASCTFKDNLRSYKLSIYLIAYNTFLQTRKEKYHEKKRTKDQVCPRTSFIKVAVENCATILNKRNQIKKILDRP